MIRRVLVTGSAGFIGSHVVEGCLRSGYEVVGLDSMSEYYDLEQKRANITELSRTATFTQITADLVSMPAPELARILEGVDAVFHLAGQPGVRNSWGREFESYLSANVLATQRLLDGCRAVGGSARIVYSSSSSIYGDALVYPTREDTLPDPRSPYGVTKLAGEHLVRAYAASFDVQAVSLRYFTVYGPRQRPDMAINRAIESALSGSEFTVFGDGTQVRDFTYVSDVVEANLLAASADIEPAQSFNIAGGTSVSVAELLRGIELATGKSLRVARGPSQPGDVIRTGASTENAVRYLDWRPAVGLVSGLARQLEWHLSRRSESNSTRLASART